MLQWLSSRKLSSTREQDYEPAVRRDSVANAVPSESLDPQLAQQSQPHQQQPQLQRTASPAWPGRFSSSSPANDERKRATAGSPASPKQQRAVRPSVVAIRVGNSPQQQQQRSAFTFDASTRAHAPPANSVSTPTAAAQHRTTPLTVASQPSVVVPAPDLLLESP